MGGVYNKCVVMATDRWALVIGSGKLNPLPPRTVVRVEAGLRTEVEGEKVKNQPRVKVFTREWLNN